MPHDTLTRTQVGVPLDARTDGPEAAPWITMSSPLAITRCTGDPGVAPFTNRLRRHPRP